MRAPGFSCKLACKLHFHASCSSNPGNSRGREKRSLKSFYIKNRKAFWLYLKNVRQISPQKSKEYFSALSRKLTDITSIKELRKNIEKEYTDAYGRALRNLFNFMEYEEMEEFNGISIERWKRNIKLKPSGIREIYISDKELREAYDNMNGDTKILFKLLAFSGMRLSQALRGIRNIQNIVMKDKIARIPITSVSRGTKRGFWIYFPLEFFDEIKGFKNNVSYHAYNKNIKYKRVCITTIRKWNYNFLIENDVPESIADFIQGRASVTIGSAHYLYKTKQADKQYGMIASFSSTLQINGKTYPVKLKIVNYTDITNHILTKSNSSVVGGQNFSLFLAPGDSDYWWDQFQGDATVFKNEIRTFVDNGGGYIGTCGGAAIACKYNWRSYPTGGTINGPFALGLVDAEAYGELNGNQQYVEREIMYDTGYGDGSGRSDWGGIPVKNVFVNETYAYEIFGKHENEKITLTYWGGAWYEPTSDSDSNFIGIAKFDEEPSQNKSLALHWKNGSTVKTNIQGKWSIIAANYDNNGDGIAGRVVLFSAHPEHSCWDLSKGVHHVVEDLKNQTYIYYYNKSGINVSKYVNSSREIDYHQIDSPNDNSTREYIRKAAVWALTPLIQSTPVNHPPNAPNSPNPKNGATGISIDVTLSWQCSDPDGDTLTYDVYFGTSSNPPLVASGITSTSYSPGTLSYSTTYYWRVVAKDEHGATTSSETWHFTTEANPNPPPNPTPPKPSPPGGDVPLAV